MIPIFYRERRLRSRQERDCRECLGTIKPGERYVYVVGMWKDFEQATTCIPCWNLWEAVRLEACVTEDEAGFGELYEFLRACGLDEWRGFDTVDAFLERVEPALEKRLEDKRAFLRVIGGDERAS